MNESTLSISFPDQSKSFTYGVEYGRLLQKMEDGKDCINNCGFPIRVENQELLKKTCEEYGYIPYFGGVWYNEWVEFIGIKKITTDN